MTTGAGLTEGAALTAGDAEAEGVAVAVDVMTADDTGGMASLPAASEVDTATESGAGSIATGAATVGLA